MLSYIEDPLLLDSRIFILFLEVILMNNLEQSITVDYYAILGVTRQSTLP